MTSSLPCGQTSLLLQMTERLALSDAHFRRISQLIYQRAGIVLADHKRDMVYNRLVRRLRALGLADFGHYLNLLESNQHSGEWQAFINSLTTNLTAFFREANTFQRPGAVPNVSASVIAMLYGSSPVEAAALHTRYSPERRRA